MLYTPRRKCWRCASLPRSFKCQSGSHCTLSRADWPDGGVAFHDSDELRPRMLANLAKHTGLTPDDL